MKSSNKSKMGDFERKWSEAFEGAEATPSDNLWTGIQAKLANADAATYKKRMVYYRWAAAIALFLLIGLTTYTFIGTDGKQIADHTNINQEPNQRSPTDRTESVLSPDEEIQTNNDLGADEKSPVDTQTADNITLDEKSSHLADQSIDQGALTDQSIGNEVATSGQVALSDDGNTPSDRNVTAVDKSVDDSGQSTDPISNTIGPEVIESVQETQGNIAEVQSGQESLVVDQPTNVSFDNTNSADPVFTDHEPSVIAESLNEEQRFGEGIEKITSSSESTWVALAGIGAEVEAVEANPQLDHIYLLPITHINQPVREEKEPKLWAGLSFAPGSFDPNYRQQAAETQLVAAAAPNARSSFIVKEDSNPGLSVAMGMDVGMNLGSRWRVTSGLQYFNSSVDANTNAVAEASNTPVYNSFSSYDLSTAADRGGINSERYIFAPNTDLQSTFEFLSVPVEAGYVVLDRKVQVVLNAGVGTNIFIKNNIQDKQNNLTDVTITPGAGAPFKTIYFNGLMGAEVLYGIGDLFNISLKPQYRTALNEFTKSNSEFSSRPSAFGVSLGLQYNIK